MPSFFKAATSSLVIAGSKSAVRLGFVNSENPFALSRPPRSSGMSASGVASGYATISSRTDPSPLLTTRASCQPSLIASAGGRCSTSQRIE